MNTTGLVMTVTDELLAELEEAASNATGGEWEYNMGLIRTMADSDGYVPVAVAPNVPSNWRKQRDMNMQYIALASPAYIAALTAELRRLRAENAELAQSLAESRANDQAAMGWLTSLRWASGDRGERMLPELVAHIEGLAKDAGRYRWLRNPDQDVALVLDKMVSSGVYEYRAGDELDTAIDTAMATQ